MSDKLKVVVAGLESSGTHWLHGILIQHPDLDATTISFPYMPHPERRYPLIPGDAINNPDVVIVMCRDETCRKLSVERLGYDEGVGDTFNGKRSARELATAWPGIRRVFVSYEGLMTYRRHYLARILEALGVP